MYQSCGQNSYEFFYKWYNIALLPASLSFPTNLTTENFKDPSYLLKIWTTCGISTVKANYKPPFEPITFQASLGDVSHLHYK